MRERPSFNLENPENQPEDQPKKVDRRAFLKSLGALGVAAASGKTAETLLHAFGEADSSLDVKKVTSEFQYDTGPLVGRAFADLYSDYTGIKGRVPKVAKINFAQQLKALCARKEAFVSRRKGSVNTAFRSAHQTLIKEYETQNPKLTTFEKYSAEIARIIKDTHTKLNWKTAQASLGIDARELALVKNIAQSITAKDIVAYSLTELMPSKEGALNRQVLDFLLRNAGERYVYSIPAAADDMTSFGPYQFTSHALYDTGKEHRGASLINHSLPEHQQLPGSVGKLRGAEHHKAAYMFMIVNIAELARRLNPNEMGILEQKWRQNKDDIVKFVATAHHLPGAAYSSARNWIGGQMKNPYEASCPPKLREYALKTKANLEALK